MQQFVRHHAQGANLALRRCLLGEGGIVHLTFDGPFEGETTGLRRHVK
jgi:hypothetical protein